MPISLALSDANHAVSCCQDLMGPVHLNIQFRENLAPEGGPIRGDGRVGSTTSFSSNRFTDVTSFNRWSTQGNKWVQSYTGLDNTLDSVANEIANLIFTSRRGIIVVGQTRPSNNANLIDATTIPTFISEFAQFAGLPIFAGVQSASLRFLSPAVVPYGGKFVTKADRPPSVVAFLTLVDANNFNRTFIEKHIHKSEHETRLHIADWINTCIH